MPFARACPTHLGGLFVSLLGRLGSRVTTAIKEFMSAIAVRIAQEISLIGEASRHDGWWANTHINLPPLVSPAQKLRRIPCALKQELVDTASSTKGIEVALVRLPGCVSCSPLAEPTNRRSRGCACTSPDQFSETDLTPGPGCNELCWHPSVFG